MIELLTKVKIKLYLKVLVMSFKNSKILFYNAIKNCTLKYYSFNGRATRSEYWIWIISTAIVSTLLFSIDISIGTYIENKSGWRILIGFTVIGIIPLIYWHCCKSFQETSKYGPASNIEILRSS